MHKTKIQSVGCLLFSVVFLSVPLVFAQDPDPSLSDSEVLVSGPNHQKVSDQDSTGNNGSSDTSSQNTTGKSNNSASSSGGIIDKATEVVISGMTANLQLTQDQISAIGPIVADNIAKGRSLQQNLEDGIIDAKTMNTQRQQLMGAENLALGSILTPAQMKIWMNMQAQDQQPPDQPQAPSNSPGRHSSSK